MAAKSGFSFGFAKKAEPKKYVAALSTKKEDNREEIKGLNESGEAELAKPKEGQGPLAIKCKNPLDQNRVAPAKSGQKPKMLGGPVEDAGIVNKNMQKLSTEDAEAMRELLKDAVREDGDAPDLPAPVPILMNANSKKVRDGNAPETTREQFENVPVESFGEAMLRGMGYDPSMHKTKPIFRDKLRDNCLGLGAKALLPGEKAQIKGKGKKATPKAATDSKAASGVAKASGIAAAEVEDEEPAEASVASSEPPQKKAKTDDADCEVVAASTGIWASRGLVVKVISKEGQLRDFFGAEAVVLKIDEAQSLCRIKARPNGGDKSQQLEGVRIQDIETRVSRDCQKVRIVRGPQKGTVAKLLKRDSARGKAVLSIEGAESEMSLDDVCQFMGE